MKTATIRPARLGVERLDGREVPAFLAPVSSTGGGVALAAGDFNHDGRDDVAAAGGTVVDSVVGLTSVVISGKVNVSLNNGDGTFRSPVTLAGAKGYYLDSIAARDVNGDGNRDVEMIAFGQHHDRIKFEDGSGSLGGGMDPTPRFAATAYHNVWLGNGDGTFGKVTATVVHNARSTVWPPIYSNDFVFADFNRDGIQDEAIVDGTSPVVWVYLRNPDFTFQPAQTYATGPNPGAITAGDFNDDGWIDLVVVNNPGISEQALSVLLNDGNW